MSIITIEAIRDYIEKNKIELECTHTKLCVPVIDRIYRKMVAGIEFFEIKVDGNHICDGHHRYIASLLANVSVGRIPSASTSATEITDWKTVSFVEEDWDTADKIKMLNEVDAEFNNKTIEEIEAILE
ncbi:MAG: hypothetical protein H3C64_05050 [Candidatus Kuenenia stuttgartiensis]|nr:hypothetical protein [Candidatus Kuenenia stuttgartiensis]